jgi:nickel-dependent lactate racemase
MAEIGTWAETWGVTDLDDKDMNAIFIKPFHNLQEALNKALEQKGKDSKVIFLMDGSITVPMID